MTDKRDKTGGRKVGTPNKATALIRQRIDAADPIGFMIQIATGETVDGSAPTIAERIKAAEWLGRKIVPDVKEKPITFNVGDINSPSDAVRAIGSVIQALSSGEITPSEATAVCGVISQYLKAYELNELDARLAQLEQSISTRRAA